MATREGAQADEDRGAVWLGFVQELHAILRLERRRSLEQHLTFRAAVFHIITAQPFIAYVDRCLELADEDVAGHGEGSIKHSGPKLSRPLTAVLRGATRDLRELRETMTAHPRKRKLEKQRLQALSRALASVQCLRHIFDRVLERKYLSQDGLMLLEKLLRIYESGSGAKGSPRE